MPGTLQSPSMMSLRQRHIDPQLAMGSQRLVESCLLAGQQGEGSPYPSRSRATFRQSRSQSFGQLESLSLPPLSSAVSHPSIIFTSNPNPQSLSPLSSSSSCLPSSVGGAVGPHLSHIYHTSFQPMDPIPDFTFSDVSKVHSSCGGSFGDLNRSDSDSSLSLSQVGDRLSAYSSKGHLIKPTSLIHGLSGRADDTTSLHAHTPNGGNRIHEGGPVESIPDSPILMKKVYGMEKSPSTGEMNSLSESSRSLSPNSTEPDTPSPTGGQPGAMGAKGNSRIPQLSAKKSPLEEDSGSTGEDTDSTASRKKHTFKIFKKQRK